MNKEDQRILNILRNPIILKIILLFLSNPNNSAYKKSDLKSLDNSTILRNQDLHKHLHFNSQGTITYYLKRLLNEKIIEKVKWNNTSISAFRLRDPRQIQSILVNYQPTESLLYRFASLWMNFFSSYKNA